MSEQCLQYHRLSGGLYTLPAIWGDMGALYSETKGPAYAKEFLQSALQDMEYEGLESLPIAGYVLFQLAKVFYDLNELDEAVVILNRAKNLVGISYEPDVLCKILFLTAWIHIATGNSETVPELLSEVKEVVRKSDTRLIGQDVSTEIAHIEFLWHAERLLLSITLP